MTNMFDEYRDIFLKLLSSLRKLQEAPFENPDLCLEIQNELYAHIVSIERKIRTHRKKIRETKSKVTKKLVKGVSKHLLANVERWQARVGEYQEVLHALHDIGDGLAFLYVDRWDIKPMAFKNGPGYISGKSGTKLERDILEECFDRGMIAIQNDLTNCLRYGDITIPHEGTFQIIEVKSGDIDRPRNQRQKKELKKIADYLREDEVKGLYGIEEVVHRQSYGEGEFDRSYLMNELLTLSYTKGSVTLQAEEGLYYYVAVDDNFDELSKVTSEAKPLVMMVNDLKFNNVAYYPFTLSIIDPLHWFDFYVGNFVLAVIIDLNVMQKKYADAGWDMDLVDDEEQPWALHLTNRMGTDEEPSEIKISRHFWGRLTAEFVSLDWFIKQSIMAPPDLEDEASTKSPDQATITPPPSKP